MEEAFELVERWMEPPNAYVPHPAKDRIHRVASLLKSVNGNHGLVADAHLARKNHAKAGATGSLWARAENYAAGSKVAQGLSRGFHFVLILVAVSPRSESAFRQTWQKARGHPKGG